ncbi:hypothetical protein ES703_73366 [subsurface metagenome]
MGDETEGPFVGIQCVGQNLAGWYIQVVGGLVEKKKIGWPDEHPGDSNAGLLATGEHRYILGDIVATEKKCPQQPTQALLRFVRRCTAQFFNNGAAWVERFYVILGEVCGGHIVTDYALSAFEQQDTGQNPQEGCLPCPIYTNDGGAVTALQCQVKVSVHNMLPVGFVNVLEFDYDAAAPWRLWKVELYLLC